MLRFISSLCVLVACGGCGLTVTQDPPAYEDLTATEKSAVQVILGELRGLNRQITARTRYNIDPILNPQRIQVAFDGLIFAGNLGDDTVHISAWENLSDDQRSLVRTWFRQGTLAGAKVVYEKFFYRFLAVSQGLKQYMYEVHSPRWVYANRSLFNIERDSIRATLSYYREAGRKAEMWPFLASACGPVLAQYGASFGPKFDKKYLARHFQELTNPEDPTGYMYFFCRWYQMGVSASVNLTVEFNWLRDLPALNR